MALLSKSFNTALTTDSEDVKIYSGETDKPWGFMGIPQGGYIVGLMLDAAMRLQAPTAHPDPLQLTAHFLKFTEHGPFEVHIQTTRVGSSYINLTLKFVQKGQERVSALAIFGVLTPSPSDDESSFTLAPPSPRAAQIPLYSHPSQCSPPPERSRWDYADKLHLVRDPYYAARMLGAEPGLRLGHYFTLKDSADKVVTQALPFFADNFMRLPTFRFLSEGKPYFSKWRPTTLVLSIEFKFPLPRADDPHRAARSVAVYSEGKFVNDPLMRHETNLELWTAPADIGAPVGEGVKTADWRAHQRCLAVVHQMGMVLPIARMKGQGPAKL